MKILAIRGKNLASLEGEFVVDFMAEPLRSAGIYAITGPTGSGKSTLLDALCLALFDETPRTKLASGKAIMTDVGDKRISQSDSRNILRRGTSEGYAEVDFVSLGGERFRSTWSVRRARNKVGGSLQNVSFRVMNLTTSTEVQGRKTELLAKVSELIGLTFYQFTRAVLLAQGDFATFLKAKQNEKAELLEKLTGTEIYSEISKGINGHAKEAEAELNLLKERMKDVELLPEEVLKEKMEEKASLLAASKALKEKLSGLATKLQWIATDETLAQALRGAEAQCEVAQKAVDGAAPRKAYLAQVEAVQVMSECYTELRNVKSQCEATMKKRGEKEAEEKRNRPLVMKAMQDVKEAEEALEKHREQVEAIQPRLKWARDLELQVKHSSEKMKETASAYKQMVEKHGLAQKALTEAEQELTLHQRREKELSAWLEEKASYEAIVKNIDWILTLVKNTATALKNEATNRRLYTTAERQLKEAEKRYEDCEKEALRLNALLPAEVAMLRAQLKENEPCPVCGSVHHRLLEVVGDTLAEQQLKVEKERNQQALEKEQRSMECKRQEMTGLLSMIKSYHEQHCGLMEQLEEHLQTVPQWREALERDDLADVLRKMARLWKMKTEEQQQGAERMQSLVTTIKWEKERVVELKGLLLELKVKAEGAQKEYDEVRDKRAQLFSGKGADDVERVYADRTKVLRLKVQRASEMKERYVAADARLKGELTQLKEALNLLGAKVKALNLQLEDWLKRQEGRFTRGLLQELLSLERSWMVQERKALEGLRDGLTKAKTMLLERQEVRRKHHGLALKPSEGETKLVLTKEQQRVLALEQEKAKLLTEIEAALTNHNRGVERLKGFKKELEAKEALTENWMKLDDLLGSASGAKFKVLAQGYTLDALLTYANKHLKELSKRYELQRVPETLALQVVDLDMLGEVRTVHSLSGGESFLISLALALGLSSLSSNRMKVESLFIDEGFGSLDMDTLRVAMDALETLQTQGRKIGVISHVAEMTERVSTQIKVVKLVNGKSKIVIV